MRSLIDKIESFKGLTCCLTPIFIYLAILLFFVCTMPGGTSHDLRCDKDGQPISSPANDKAGQFANSYSLDFGFNRDIVRISVEDYGKMYLSKVDCLIDFDVYASLRHNYAENLRLNPINIAFVYPKGAFNFGVDVNDKVKPFDFVANSSRYISENITNPTDYLDNYGILEFSIPWENTTYYDNSFLMHPSLDITYLESLNRSDGEYILKYGLISLDYKLIDILIMLPPNIDSNSIRSKPDMGILQNNTGIYLTYINRSPEDLDYRKNLTDVEVRFRPKNP
jgi:hypothetical protein